MIRLRLICVCADVNNYKKVTLVNFHIFYILSDDDELLNLEASTS